ncbi:MAG: hypothetical protein ACRES9_09845 [Gammaproteobacteria bacterium]
MNKRLLTTTALMASVLALGACSKHHAMKNRNMTAAQASALQAASANRAARMASASGMPMATAGTAAAAMSSTQAAKIATSALPNLAYTARLYPLNDTITRKQVTGRAQFAIQSGKLTIQVVVNGAAPGIRHMQHVHGLVNGKAASCPTDTADTNGDGVVSAGEAVAVAGPPLIFLNDNVLAINSATSAFPMASAGGSYRYQQTVSWSALQKAYAKTHNGKKLNLANDVVMIHGVLPGAKLPMAAAVATAAGTRAAAANAVPAPRSVPIACGKISKVPQ